MEDELLIERLMFERAGLTDAQIARVFPDIARQMKEDLPLE